MKLFIRSLIAATVSFVLCGCQQTPLNNASSPSSTHRPGAQTTVAESEQKALNSMYGGDNPVPKFDDLAGDVSVEQVVRKRSKSLDLRFLSYFEHKLTKKDLEPLASPDAVNYTTGLNLSNLKLTDDDIEPVAHLHLLNSLTLTNNHVRSLSSVAPLTGIDNLDLTQNDIDERGMSVIGKLPKLVVVRLSKNPISDADLPKLYGLKKLYFLTLTYCPHVTKAGVERLRKAMPHTCVEFEPHVIVSGQGKVWVAPPEPPKDPEDLGF